MFLIFGGFNKRKKVAARVILLGIELLYLATLNTYPLNRKQIFFELIFNCYKNRWYYILLYLIIGILFLILDKKGKMILPAYSKSK